MKETKSQKGLMMSCLMAKQEPQEYVFRFSVGHLPVNSTLHRQ